MRLHASIEHAARYLWVADEEESRSGVVAGRPTGMPVRKRFDILSDVFNSNVADRREELSSSRLEAHLAPFDHSDAN